MKYYCRSVFTIGRNLQFFNPHRLVKVSDRHQLLEIPFQWFDPINSYVSRAGEKFSLRVHYIYCWSLHLISWKMFLNFQLKLCADASMLAEQWWGTNMAQSQSSIWLILWGNSTRVWHLCLIRKLVRSNRCLQLCLVAKFSPQNKNSEYEWKWHWKASGFTEPRSVGPRGTFWRLTNFCLSIY